MRYTREDGCRAWLSRAGLSYRCLSRLLEEHEMFAEAVYEDFLAEGEEMAEEYRIPPTALSRMRKYSQRQEMHQVLVAMQKKDMGILCPADEKYPDALRSLEDQPLLLYYIGEPDCLMSRCITMVGSRSASMQALEATERFARDFSAHGATVVSGLAYGIDSAAHRGCLSGGSPTAAVMACGLDVAYPVGNEALRRELLDGGGVLLSEYAPGTPALGYNFPVRNRIMSGLSRAVVMMECRVQSGTMRTVNHALEQGRDVYAWPGRIGTEWGEGAHQLLREGALFFTESADILKDLGWADEAGPSPEKRKKAKEQLPPMSEEQRRIMKALALSEELSYDQLAQQTGLDPAALSIHLTMLQLSGLIKSMPGKMFAKA